MKDYILLQTYVGGSDFRYETACSGRMLSDEEARTNGFIDDSMIRRHRKSSYSSQWFEIEPGDTITLMTTDEDRSDTIVFTVPDVGLPDAPKKMDEGDSRLERYLKDKCEHETTSDEIE